ncbi:MAG: hypothetical protein K9G80_11145 [Candidatus Nanopelagicales bacterium]|nr:hypothetical protein [Candidatus Nanopelagicales bacterium]
MNRSPKAHRHRCGSAVLTGLDGDLAALAVTVDAALLSAVGEVQALTLRRRTYQHYRGALDRRDRWNVPGHPPSLGLPVHVEHRCTEPPPADWLLPIPAASAPAILTPEEGIPF